LVEPRASEPSLNVLGTALMLSSLMLIIVGKTIAASTIAAARILKPVPPICLTRGTISIIPTNPYTT
jgi:hypothetical protein